MISLFYFDFANSFFIICLPRYDKTSIGEFTSKCFDKTLKIVKRLFVFINKLLKYEIQYELFCIRIIICNRIKKFFFNCTLLY